LRRALPFILLAVIGLTGCGRPANQAYATPQKAIEGRLRTPVTVYQETPTDGGVLLIFQRQSDPAPMVGLVEGAGWGRWRMWPGYDAGPMTDIGPVAFHQKTVGYVVTKYEDGSESFHGKTFTMYGVVNDPGITWVEVTLPQLPDDPRRAPVVNGTWLVQWPRDVRWPPYPKARLRAGNDTGELFAADNVWAVPEVKR